MSFQRCKSSFRDDVPWLSKTSCLCVFGVFGIFGISKVFGSNLVRTTLISLNLELDFKSGSAKIRTLNRTFGPVPKSSVRTLVQNRTTASLQTIQLAVRQWSSNMTAATSDGMLGRTNSRKYTYFLSVMFAHHGSLAGASSMSQIWQMLL